jgi:hypothetical protein
MGEHSVFLIKTLLPYQKSLNSLKSVAPPVCRRSRRTSKVFTCSSVLQFSEFTFFTFQFFFESPSPFRSPSH